MQRAIVKVTGFICGEYWGLVGTVSQERYTTGQRRNHLGEIETVEIEPCCEISFDDTADFRERSAARGGPGLVSRLVLPVSALTFIE